MSLVRTLENPDYWPEYSTLVVRDVPAPGGSGTGVSSLLAQHAVDTHPCGSLARAGDGWLEAFAFDSHHAVRLEVHDAPPAGDDLSEWDDAVETPFASGGTVALGMVTGGTVGEPVELGPPGLYRLSLACRPAPAGSLPGGLPCEFRLRVWPVPGPPEPPRWLRRSRPLVDPRPPAEWGAFDGRYLQALTDVVMLVLWAAEGATPVTLAWLADRMSTSTATVRGVLEHPRTAQLLAVGGDLDDPTAALALTVHGRPPATLARTRTAPAKATRPGPGTRATAPKRNSNAAHRVPMRRAVRPRPHPPEPDDPGDQP